MLCCAAFPKHGRIGTKAANFTVVDVVGHLIYADRVDWMPRARMILEHGENKTFEPFDRWGHVEIAEARVLPSYLKSFDACVPVSR